MLINVLIKTAKQTYVFTRVTLFWISIHDDIRNLRHDLLDQTISQHGHPLMIILNKQTNKHALIPLKCSIVWEGFLDVWLWLFYLHLLLGDATGSSQSNSQWGRDSARAQPPLLPATVLYWLQTHPWPATHVQRTHTWTHTHVVSIFAFTPFYVHLFKDNQTPTLTADRKN